MLQISNKRKQTIINIRSNELERVVNISYKRIFKNIFHATTVIINKKNHKILLYPNYHHHDIKEYAIMAW